MKTKIAALTVLLFAGAATAALAQEDRDRGESRGEARAEHPANPVPRAAPAFREDRPAPVVQPRSEPPQQAQPQHRFEGGRPDGWRGGEGRRGGGPDAQPQPQAPAQPRADGERRWQGRDNQTPAQPRADGERRWQGRDGQTGERQGRGDQNRGDQAWRGEGRDGQGRGGWDGQRRDGGDRNNADRRGRDRSGGRWDQNDVRHGGDRRDGERNNGRWDGPRDHGGRWEDHGRPRWDHNRYPPVYRSHQRYRSYWRPPVGYYAYSWGFGDILPSAWYTPEYRLYDWWSYDLPAPPPGYSWVRVGYDAILVDDFDGRVVQVVRLVFY